MALDLGTQVNRRRVAARIQPVTALDSAALRLFAVPVVLLGCGAEMGLGLFLP